MEKELGVLLVRATSQPTGVPTHNQALLMGAQKQLAQDRRCSNQGCRLIIASCPNSAVLRRRQSFATLDTDNGDWGRVEVEVRRANRGFKHILPDTASSRHSKEGGVGLAQHITIMML